MITLPLPTVVNRTTCCRKFIICRKGPSEKHFLVCFIHIATLQVLLVCNLSAVIHVIPHTSILQACRKPTITLFADVTMVQIGSTEIQGVWSLKIRCVCNVVWYSHANLGLTVFEDYIKINKHCLYDLNKSFYRTDTSGKGYKHFWPVWFMFWWEQFSYY